MKDEAKIKSKYKRKFMLKFLLQQILDQMNRTHIRSNSYIKIHFLKIHTYHPLIEAAGNSREGSKRNSDEFRVL